MNTAIFKRPVFWVVLYFLVLIGVGLLYAETLKSTSSLRVTGVQVLTVDEDSVSLRVQGEQLPQHVPAYLVLDAINKHAIVGSIPLWGRSVDIKIIQDKAYVVSQGEGVKIFDLNDPVNPAPAGHFPGKSSAWRGDADEKLFYLSSMLHGVAIYNIAEKQKLDDAVDIGAVWSTVHRGSSLFIANGAKGVLIIDAAESNNIKKIGHIDLPGVTVSLDFLRQFLIAASSSGGIHLIDISNIEHPHVLQTLLPSRSYEKVIVNNDTLYAADGGSKVDIFSLEDGQLRKLTSFSTFGTVRDFLFDGNFLYVAESSYGVSKLDVSDPQHPRRLGFVGTQGEPSGLGIYQNYLYVASGSQGVKILDTELFAPRKSIGAVDTPGNAVDLLVDGDWIYVADEKSGLQIIDRSDLDHLRIVANLPVQGRARTLLKNKSLLYLGLDNKSLIVIDVSDPKSPKLMNSLPLDFRISALAIRGETLFVGTFDYELVAIDISSPTQPWVSQVLDLPGKIRGLAVRGDYVFVAADKAGLLVAAFKARQPGRLVAALKQTWPMSEFSAVVGIAVHGRYAYLVQGEESVQIVDISRPEEPIVLTRFYHSGRSIGIELTDEYAVLSTRWSGYSFINIRDPEHPFFAAHLNSPRGTGGFKIEGDKLYAAGRTTGISILPLPLKNISSKGGADLSIIFPKPKISGWYDLTFGGRTKGASVVASVEID